MTILTIVVLLGIVGLIASPLTSSSKSSGGWVDRSGGNRF